MHRIKRFLKKERGEAEVSLSIALVVGIFIIAIFVVATIPIIGSLNNNVARSKLEGSGYTVLSAGEYGNIMSELADAEAAALAANNAAVLAAGTSENILDKLLLFNENEAFIWPDSTLTYCLLTAGTPADNFSTWTEITDNNSVKLTATFAATSGYIREVTLYAYSVVDKLCILEIGFGANIGAVTTIGRCVVRSDFTWVLDIYSEQIPAGQKVYYRFKSEQAGETFRAYFKYLYVV
jgi:hypothetical protein